MKGVEQQYRSSEEYHEAWKMKARDLLAKSEFRKRKITMRVSAAAAGPALPPIHAWPRGQLRNGCPQWNGAPPARQAHSVVAGQCEASLACCS